MANAQPRPIYLKQWYGRQKRIWQLICTQWKSKQMFSDYMPILSVYYMLRVGLCSLHSLNHFFGLVWFCLEKMYKLDFFNPHFRQENYKTISHI